MQIGELMIKMGADVAQLRTDMADARRTVGGAMSDIRNAVGLAQRAIVLLGGAATAAGFASMIRGAIEAKANLFDLALQAGMTVESLSALQEVGKLSNTGTEQIVAASNRLSKALIGVDEESKGAGQALRALGLNVESFKRLSADQQLVSVAKAMEGFSDGIERGQAAMLLFGKSGAELLPFLKELAETEMLVSKETTESARRAKEFEDNLVKLRSAGVDFTRQLADELLPVLVEVSRELTTINDKGSESNLFAEGVRIAFEAITVLGANVSFTLKGMGREIGAIAAQLVAIGTLNFKGFNAISEAVKADGERARAELDAFERRILSARERSLVGPTTGDFTRLDRASKPRLRIPRDDDKDKNKIPETQRLIATIRERVAAEELEADTDAKLTAGQKLALDVMVKLRDGKLEATTAERRLLAAELERLLLQEKANTAAEKERKESEEDARAREQLLESLYKQTQGLRQQAEAAELEADSIGLTTKQLRELEIARTLDAAATLQQRAEAMQAIPGYEQLAQLYREQAAALDRLANAKARGLTREDQLRSDPFAGARRGLEDYQREISDVNAAAYSLVQNTARTIEDEGTAAFGRLVSTGSRAVDQLIAEVFRLAVVRPLLSSIFGSGFGGSLVNGVGALLGSGGGGGGGALAPVVDSVPAVFAAGAGGGGGRSGIQSLTINQTTVNHIDSRSDAAQIDEIARDRAAESTRGLVTELQSAGVV